MLGKLVAVLGISLSVSFLCSVLEAILLSVTHGYVHVLRERGSRAGRYLHRMQEQVDEPIAAILTLNTIANTFGAALGGALALQLFGSRWMAAFSAALTLAILLFSEILPKTLGATLWPRLAPAAAYLLRGLIIVMKPVLVPLSFYARLITPSQARPSTVSRAELAVLARIGRRDGTIDEEEWRVVEGLMSLPEVEVAEVMTPRTDMVAVPVDASVEEAKRLMLEEGHLRLPVYEETLDRIVGILLARDLWRADLEGIPGIREIMRPPRFTPATKPVGDLIREMRAERLKMVIVVDEFGGTAGLVTLEDLLEEIVGEIQDEHEADEPRDFIPLPGGAMRIRGATPVRDVNERLGLSLPEEEYDTLAGFLLSRLHRIGRVGDSVEWDGGIFRILRVRGRRIEEVLFTPRPEREEGEGP